MRNSTLEANDLEALRLLEDEWTRTRAGFSMGQLPFLGDIPDPGVNTMAAVGRPISFFERDQVDGSLASSSA
jgi:hypothetical protein